MKFQLAESGDIDDFEGMVAERKLDGSRAMMIDNKIVNRSGKHYHQKLPEIETTDEMVLDGEIITHNFEFSSVLSRIMTENPGKIKRLSKDCPAFFVVYDILEKGGEDLTDLPWNKRKEELDGVTKDLDNVLEITTHDNPEELWERAVQEDWEGIILKDPNATYNSGRNNGWIKIKHWEEEVFEIIKHEKTDNDGIVIHIDIGTEESQKVVVNGHKDQEKLENEYCEEAEIQYLERSDSNRLRKPSFKRFV